jgi:transcriptional regulator with XRE-family HTH domain
MELPIPLMRKTTSEKFGRHARAIRMAKGISQEELAFRAGMHRTYLSGIERGKRNPSLKNIAAIAKALEVTQPELFNFEE